MRPPTPLCKMEMDRHQVPSSLTKYRCQTDSSLHEDDAEAAVANYLRTGQTGDLERTDGPKGESLIERQKRTHHVWKPEFSQNDINRIIAPLNKLLDPRPPAEIDYEESFISYLDVPSLIGEAPLPTLVHHTSCAASDQIFILGGFQVHTPKEKINGDNYNIVEDVPLPVPLRNVVLSNPFFIPNSKLYVVSSITNRVTTPVISGDVPPPLICMSSAPLNHRYIFYYGGFELINHVTEVEENKFEIRRSMRINNACYVLDTYTNKFQKFTLTAHPNIDVRDPYTTPRFGHSAVSIRTPDSCIALVYITGGYRYSLESRKFEPIKDMWKIEFSVIYEGSNNYLELGDVVLATPMTFPAQVTPSARAFHDVVFYEGALVLHGGTDGVKVLGDMWKIDLTTLVWEKIESFYQGEKVQAKKVCHQGVLLDKYYCPLLGSIPSDLPGLVQDDDDGLLDISSIYRTWKFEHMSESAKFFYNLLCFDMVQHRWFFVRVYHDYYLPVFGYENELSNCGIVGCTVTMSNTRTILIGGVLTMDQKKSPFTDQLILNSAVSCFEFPLGYSTHDTVLLPIDHESDAGNTIEHDDRSETKSPPPFVDPKSHTVLIEDFREKLTLQ